MRINKPLVLNTILVSKEKGVEIGIWYGDENTA